MALPNGYSNPRQYFADAVKFLREFAWIYQHSNTAFVKAGILDKFPNDFKEYFLHISNDDLNEFPLLCDKAEAFEESENLRRFRKMLSALIPSQSFAEVQLPAPNRNDKQILRKMNLKKQHEIRGLSEIIVELCADCDLLIDFGAGLGYLSELLYMLSDNKFLILGLESEESRVQAAQQRQKEFMPVANEKIVYRQQFITEASLPFITNCAQTLAKGRSVEVPSMAIVGLHACADLTITAMRLFFNIGPQLRRLIIMPCCYHKLEMNAENGFRNFPLSAALKSSVEEIDRNFSQYLNRPFLRLACQQTLARWLNTTAEEHNRHGRQMFKRGIVEAIINDEFEVAVKRREVSKQSGLSARDDSFGSICEEYEMISKVTEEKVPWNAEHEVTFDEVSGRYVEGYKLAEGLTCLQTAMQKLCENIVLYDRLCYMQEQAAALALKLNVRYEKLLDEKLSPRCYALIAEKL